VIGKLSSKWMLPYTSHQGVFQMLELPLWMFTIVLAARMSFTCKMEDQNMDFGVLAEAVQKEL
jgi:hypothetical protein